MRRYHVVGLAVAAAAVFLGGAGAASVKASLVTIDLTNASATLTPISPSTGFGTTYNGTLKVQQDSNTSLTLTDAFSQEQDTFNTATVPYSLTAGETNGIFSFTAGKLAAGAITFNLHDGALTDTLTVNYSSTSISAIKFAGAPSNNNYTIATTVTGYSASGPFGGLDFGGIFSGGALTELQLHFAAPSPLSDSDANTNIVLTGLTLTPHPVPLPAASGIGFSMLSGFGALFAIRGRLRRRRQIV